MIYAPCDICNFPIKDELMKPDLLILHLGFFKDLVPKGWRYESEDSFEEAGFNIIRKEFENSMIFWFGYEIALEEAKAEDLSVYCIF